MDSKQAEILSGFLAEDLQEIHLPILQQAPGETLEVLVKYFRVQQLGRPSQKRTSKL
jgi:hypothetical protein